MTIGVEDHPRGPEEMPVFSSQILVGEGYFEAMGIQLLEGRTFQPGDGADGTGPRSSARTSPGTGGRTPALSAGVWGTAGEMGTTGG